MNANHGIEVNQTSPPPKIHIRCKCGVEIKIDSNDTINVTHDVRCPQCGENHIVIRADGSVGIGV